MAKKDPLLTVRLPAHLIVEFSAAAKMEYSDSSELLRKFVVDKVEAAKRKDFALFNEKLVEALTGREKRQKITKPPATNTNRAASRNYLMSTGKGKAPNEQDIHSGQTDIKKARKVARSIERKRGREK